MTTIPALPVTMYDENETIVVSTPAGYWQAIWEGFRVSGPVPPPARSEVPAHLSDLDTVEAKIPSAASLSASLSATFAGLPSGYAKTKVLILGSSNAAGVGASSYANAWPALLATRLASTHEFVNPSVSGRSPTYWITPDATTGRVPLEDLIVQHQPHIVIAAYATQNAPGQPSEQFITYVELTQAMCEARGIRFLGISPYISEDYDAAKRDNVARICETMRVRGIPLLNFQTIWGPGPLLPDSIDSGDGLHVNNAGHAEQAKQVPTDMLSLTSRPRLVRLPAAGGVTVPAAVTTAFDLNAVPQGSWTIGFTMKLPAVDKWSTAALYFNGGGLNQTRVRFPSANQIDVGGSIVHPTSPVASATEHHFALSYNAVTGESRWYVDGVRLSTSTAPTGLTATSVSIGYRGDSPSSTANGYRFRNLTVHATVLTDADVVRLAGGEVAPASIAYAAPLTDGVGRPVGGIFAAAFGQESKVTTAIALP